MSNNIDPEKQRRAKLFVAAGTLFFFIAGIFCLLSPETIQGILGDESMNVKMLGFVFLAISAFDVLVLVYFLRKAENK